MKIEELQHSLEAHKMRVNKRKIYQEQALQAQTNYKGKGKGPWKRNKSSTNQKHQDQEFVNPLKKGGQAKHRSKATAPKIARSGSLTRGK
ncbi:hypothetical protein CR513_27872, partial [Mucuna pruriens]